MKRLDKFKSGMKESTTKFSSKMSDLKDKKRSSPDTEKAHFDILLEKVVDYSKNDVLLFIAWKRGRVKNSGSSRRSYVEKGEAKFDQIIHFACSLTGTGSEESKGTKSSEKHVVFALLQEELGKKRVVGQARLSLAEYSNTFEKQSVTLNWSDCEGYLALSLCRRSDPSIPALRSQRSSKKPTLQRYETSPALLSPAAGEGIAISKEFPTQDNSSPTGTSSSLLSEEDTSETIDDLSSDSDGDSSAWLQEPDMLLPSDSNRGNLQLASPHPTGEDNFDFSGSTQKNHETRGQRARVRQPLTKPLTQPLVFTIEKEEKKEPPIVDSAKKQSLRPGDSLKLGKKTDVAYARKVSTVMDLESRGNINPLMLDSMQFSIDEMRHRFEEVSLRFDADVVVNEAIALACPKYVQNTPYAAYLLLRCLSWIQVFQVRSLDGSSKGYFLAQIIKNIDSMTCRTPNSLVILSYWLSTCCALSKLVFDLVPECEVKPVESAKEADAFSSWSSSPMDLDIASNEYDIELAEEIWSLNSVGPEASSFVYALHLLIIRISSALSLATTSAIHHSRALSPLVVDTVDSPGGNQGSKRRQQKHTDTNDLVQGNEQAGELVLFYLKRLYESLNEAGIPEEVSECIVEDVVSRLDVQIFNVIFCERSRCTPPRAISLKFFFSHLSSWIAEALPSLFKRLFFYTKEAADVIITNKVPLVDPAFREDICPNLTLDQVLWILSSFVPDDLAPDAVKPAVLIQLQAQADESTSSLSDSRRSAISRRKRDIKVRKSAVVPPLDHKEWKYEHVNIQTAESTSMPKNITRLKQYRNIT